MKYPVYLYIAVMAIVTYLIRMLPLTLIKKEIKNPFIRSFLYYVPYVTLSVMTFRPLSTQLLLLFPELPLWQWHCFSLIQERACSRFPLQACAIVFILEFFVYIIALTWKICHWQVLTSE